VTDQAEVPAGLQWLQATIGDLREQVAELQKANYRLHLKVGALEGDRKILEDREIELAARLQALEAQGTESSLPAPLAVEAPAPLPLVDGGNGLRHSPPVSADQELSPAARGANSMRYPSPGMTGEEKELRDRRAYLDALDLPREARRVVDADIPSGR
jgi:hypothetical protein